jgi:hypothetical protein
MDAYGRSWTIMDVLGRSGTFKDACEIWSRDDDGTVTVKLPNIKKYCIIIEPNLYFNQKIYYHSYLFLEWRFSAKLH